MKLWQLFGIAALSIGAIAGHAQAEVPEQAPSEAQVNVCTADNKVAYMDMKIEAQPEAITYGLWGAVADRVRETLGHFTIDQIRNDDDLLMAALDSMGLKAEQDYGVKLTGSQAGMPPHGCGEETPKVPLRELFVGQVDACIANKETTVSVVYGIVTKPTPEFRKDMEAAIEGAISAYNGNMETSAGLQEALTQGVLAAEKKNGGETFFRFAPSGALQEGCHPAKLGM